MDFRKFSTIIITLSLAAIASAIYWWSKFYGDILGKNLGEARSCIYSDSGWCGFTAGAAKFLGESPYEPKLFIGGVIGLVLGALIKLSLKTEEIEVPQPSSTENLDKHPRAGTGSVLPIFLIYMALTLLFIVAHI